MVLGQADYHITKPWLLEQDLYREVSEFLAEWAKDQEAGFELFHLVGRLQDPGTNTLRELLTRFYVPFHFHDADSGPGRRLLEHNGLRGSRLPVLIRHDGYTVAEPTTAADHRGGRRQPPGAIWTNATWSSWGPGQPASLPRSMPPRRACRRWCWKRRCPAARPETAR